MTNRYDVIVVGAGPGGSTTARHLARAGLKTLLLEKEKIPRYKPCGGGITGKVADVLDVDFSATIEDSIQALSVAYGRRRFPVNLGRQFGWSVMRDRFDQLLALKAVEAGAELRDETTVRGVEIDGDGVRVQTARESLMAQVIVGADGANGMVARAAGLRKERRLAAALEAEMDLPSSSIEAWRGVWHLDFAAIPWGYGWIFPKAEHLSVGIGTFRPELRLNLREVLNRYLASEPTLQNPKRVMLRGHLLPVGGHFEPVHAPRVLLVGDAAGLVDPFTGEGIYAAIKSGALAADEITQSLSSGSFAFSKYSPRIHAEFHRDYRYGWILNKVFYRVPQLAVRAMQHLASAQRAAGEIVYSAQGYKRTFLGILTHPI